jgi:hypothetical protein
MQPTGLVHRGPPSVSSDPRDHGQPSWARTVCTGLRPVQSADLDQKADAYAEAEQEAVNVNVPVTVGGGDVFGGDSLALQLLENDAEAENEALVSQIAAQATGNDAA